MRLTVEGAATRIEGPLLFLRRTLDVGLADAVEVRGRDGRTRLGRIAPEALARCARRFYGRRCEVGEATRRSEVAGWARRARRNVEHRKVAVVAAALLV